jgi:DNA gyrase subunit A
VANLLPISGEERVTSMIRVSAFEENRYLIMVTKNGVIKRTDLKAFDSARKGGLIALDLDEGDELSWVRLTDGSQEIIVATKKGKAIRFNEMDVRAVGRSARGVRALRLKPDDEVVGMIIVEKDALILTVSETGYGRLSDPSDYRIQSRGGQGVINYHTEKYGDIAALHSVNSDQDVILISDSGIIIRIEAHTIRKCSRPSKGVKVMRLTQGSKIVAVACVPREEKTDIDTDIDVEEHEQD